MQDILKFAHLAAAIVWLGGMACLLFAVRPALLAQLEPQPRARLMVQIWQRFFNIVGVCVLVLLGSGAHLYTSGYRAAKTVGASLPVGWSVMAGAGLLMALLFGHIYFAGFKKFKRAVAAGEFPLAAKAATQIHTFVVANFVLGWLAIAAVRLLR